MGLELGIGVDLRILGVWVGMGDGWGLIAKYIAPMFLKRSVHQNTLRLFASALIAFLVLVCRGNKWRGIRKRMMPGSYHQM